MKKKVLALLLSVAMVASMASCGKNDSQNVDGSSDSQVTESTPGSTDGNSEGEVTDDQPSYTVAEMKPLATGEYGTDYIRLYEQFGDVTIDEVIEDPETGFAYIERDGVRYELGMDFLSYAMVYNCDVPAGGRWETANDVYVTWYKYYMQRWNYLLPEVPLYSNEYYDLYNTQITGVQEHPTNPFWSVTDALIDWDSNKDDKSIIVGNTTELSGLFRYAAFGTSNPGAADLDVQDLTNAMSTMATSKEGEYVWDNNVVESHSEAENADGSKTYTVKIKDDLQFSDGSPITAKNYLVYSMAFTSAPGRAATGREGSLSVVGYDSYSVYDGTNEGADVDGVVATKEFAGLRLLGDYEFSVTISADFLPYIYDYTYALMSPYSMELWLGEGVDIVDDGNGCYLTENFYTNDSAAHITASSLNTDDTYPYTGPYMVQSFDKAASEAVLVKNPYYKGNYEGTVPAIEKIVYRRVISATQLADLQSGGVDVISGITGGSETDEAVAMADGSNGAFAYVHYSRAGYGKLGFRADYGPAQFTEVRQAIAYCMDRAAFAKTFTGGYGGVVDGPYYSGTWFYLQAVQDEGMLLNAYSTSVDSAIAVLEEGGWVYDKDGNAYTDGVRYKQIPANEINDNDKKFQSKDGAYVTTQVGDYYYMPLVINWYGTADNPFTDQLVTGFMEDDNIAAAGMVVQNTIGEFNPMLDELYQEAIYGYYSGTPMYNAFNFATGFTSMIYDYSYNWTIDPALYDNYSICYLKDEADAYWLK